MVSVRDPDDCRLATVLIIGSFPPPLFGNAIATERLAALFAGNGFRVEKSSTSAMGRRDVRSLRYHIARIRGAARAAACARRTNSSVVVLALSGGFGLLYDLLVVMCLRRRVEVVLQHHTYRYLRRRSRLLAAVVSMRPSALHLCSCDVMRADLVEMYGVRRSATLSMAYTVWAADGCQPQRRQPPAPGGAHHRVGFVGTLSVEKGADLALDVVEELAGTGIEIELVVAGRTMFGSDSDLSLRLERSPLVQMLGSVPNEELGQQVYGKIDALLFPTTYAYESYGLVVIEALSFGVPVFAIEAGCLTQSLVGESGRVVTSREEFLPVTLESLTRFYGDDDERHRSVVAALSAFDVELARSRRDAANLFEHELRR